MNAQELLMGERKTVIAEMLMKSGRVLATQLAELFGVSEDTVRRDLREMAAAGLCERVYGGALKSQPVSTALSLRMTIGQGRKEMLALAALGELKAGSTVFFDAGSTNLAIARALPDDLELIVATNAPVIASALIEKPLVEVVLIGGSVDKRIGGALGAKALLDMEQLAPDLCILGACGADIEAGLTAINFEDAEFKRFAATQSRRVVAAITSEKFGAVAPYRVLPVARCECLVVEHDAQDEMIEPYRLQGCRVIRAAKSKK